MAGVISIETGDRLNIDTGRVSLDEGRMIAFTLLELAIYKRTGFQGCQKCGELAWEDASKISYGVRRSNSQGEKNRSQSIFSAYLIAECWDGVTKSAD